MKPLILAAAALLGLSLPAMAQTRLATEGAYPPYNYVDDQGNVGGFDIDVGNEICKRAALDCTWVVNEWDTLIPNLIAGNYDAIIAAMSITDERKKSIDFTTQYFPAEPSTFMTPAGKTFDFENLSGVKIGAQAATLQASYVDSTYKANNQILTYQTADQALADLNAGNVDMIFAEESYVGDTTAGSSGALVQAGPAVPLGDGYGIGIRKVDTDLKAKFDAALDSMKTDGTLDAYITLYFPDKEGGPFYGTE